MPSRRPSDRRQRKLVTSTAKLDEAFVEASEQAKKDRKDEPAAAAPPPASGKKPPADAPAPQADTPPPEPQIVPPDPESRPIGEGAGWVVVDVDDDRLNAVVSALALNGLELSAKELAVEIARAYELKGTFNGKILRQALSNAKAEGVVRGAFPVLEGVPPGPGINGTLDIVCVPDAVEDKRGALGGDFATALKAGSLDEVLAFDVSGLLVAPGDVVARIVDPAPGTPGRDVYGEPLVVDGVPVEIEAGNGLRLEDGELTAEVFGWLRLRKTTFEVVSPFWISPDATAGHFVHFPELRRRRGQIDPAWLHAALAAAGVDAGVDEEAIARLCAHWPAATERTSVQVAAAVEPQHGEDAHIEFTTDPEKRVGRVREDGTIDYRERNAAAGVAAGDLIGRFVEATTGTAGVDLRGKQLPARDGESKSFSAGENVKTQNEGDAVAYYAEIDGALVVSGETIEVQPIFTITGDVDYETGNIDLPMNVEIGGSVKAEFSVKSSGSITIAGSLEPGARVEAAGDIVIASGIFGEKTRVVAGGSLETKLIQNATVTVGGDLTVGSYIYSGIVLAGGTITVEEGGSERAGSIVGGEAVAGVSIQCQRIGSEQTDRTLVGIGATPAQRQELRDLESQETATQREISSLLDEIKLAGVTDAEIEARVARCKSSEERERVQQVVDRLRVALDTRSDVQQGISALEEQIAQTVAVGTIRAERIHEDVLVEFGEDVMRIGDPIRTAEFFVGEQGPRWRPL